MKMKAKHHDWATPPALFDEWNREFGFVLDVCAEPHNAKCERFFSPAEDGLAQDWAATIDELGGGCAWCNPPYGHGQVEPWLERIRLEQARGVTTVALLPNSSDTAWYHDHVHGIAEVRPLKGRVKFIPPPSYTGDSDSPNFASILCVYRSAVFSPADRRRRVFELRQAGQSIRQIAKAVGCSVGTVHADLHADQQQPVLSPVEQRIHDALLLHAVNRVLPAHPEIDWPEAQRIFRILGTP